MSLEAQVAEHKVSKVLFLCTGNSCRSQMAEGLVNAHLSGRFQAVSAGTHPVPVNQNAVRVMSEAGYDISGQRSQSLDEFSSDSVDMVISVCDEASKLCPDFPGARRIHWSIPDPAGATGSDEEVLGHFRTVRDELRDRILKELDA